MCPLQQIHFVDKQKPDLLFQRIRIGKYLTILLLRTLIASAINIGGIRDFSLLTQFGDFCQHGCKMKGMFRLEFSLLEKQFDIQRM